MIDLTKNQILDPPVEMYVRDLEDDEYEIKEIYSIDHRIAYPFGSKYNFYKFAKLIKL